MATKKKQHPALPPVPTPAAAHALLSSRQVAVLLGNVGKSTLFRMIRSGEFPRPDASLGEKLPRWSTPLFNAWVEAKTSAPTAKRQ